MNTTSDDAIALNTLPRPKSLFPLVRQLSYRISPIFARLKFSPNMITLIGLATGVASAFAFAQGSHSWGMTGALLWAICSLMDYCDGEVARITGSSSKFGRYMDDVVDWLVHTALFAGLGIGALAITNNNLWLWLGLIAAAGTTINSWMNWLREWLRYHRKEEDPHLPGESILPANKQEYFLYVFRGLFRADFWLLIILLELFHITWLLLPVFAIGTNIYWITGFIKGADKFIP